MSNEHPTPTTPPNGSAWQAEYGQGLGPADVEPTAHQPVNPYPSTTYSAGPYAAPTAPVPPPPTIPAPATPAAAAPATRTTRRGRWLAIPAAVLAASVLSSGATAAALHAWPTGSGAATTTVTQVVQGDTSSPDWTVTAAKAQASVVSITVTSGQSEALGSGVVWSADGLVVTNHHVVAALGSGAKIQVEFSDGTVTTATVVGSDAETDLAVIKLADVPSGLTPIQVATDELKVGQPVMAIGNPLGLSDTVTTGIVSALNRPVIVQQQSESGQGQPGLGLPGDSRGNANSSTDTTTSSVTSAIQTNAAINPGNSGGALVNADGQLIGITSSIASLGSSSSEAGNIGIGFAIPVAQVSNVVDQLLSTGKVAHAALGVSGTDTTVTTTSGEVAGVGVSEVSANSSAADAGLTDGDVITAVNGQPVTSTEDLLATIRSLEVGAKAQLTVVRAGQTRTVDVTLGEAGN